MAELGIEELLAVGYRGRREHRPADARQSFAAAVEASREAGNPRLLAVSLAGLGQIERDLGNPVIAAQHYRESLALLRSEDDPQALAHTVRHLGDILRHLGATDESAACYREALGVYRLWADAAPLDLANTLRGYALLKCTLGEREEAIQMWREAGALYASVGVEAGVSESKAQIERLSAGDD